jgi:hypothetical protein
MSAMESWLTKNWQFVAAVAACITAFSLLQYRVNVHEGQIEVLQQQAQSSLIVLAQIQKDIEFIKLQVSKIED